MAQMAEGENEWVSGAHRPQRSRQIISVPYLWEAKPGVPKKEWVSKPISMISFPSPARLVVSVPFQWEEKPGKPFTELPQSSPGSDITLNQSGFLDLLPLPFCSPSTYPPNPSHTTQTAGKNPFIDDDDDEMAPGLDLEAFTLEIAPGLNPFLLSNAHASQESSSEDSSNQKESWYSVLGRNHHSSPNSFVTTSIDSASTLEFRFPLFSPDAGFLKKVSGQERAGTAAFPELLFRNSCRSSGRFTVRRSMTLEELILLSRNLSNRMRPMEERKPSSLMVLSQ